MSCTRGYLWMRAVFVSDLGPADRGITRGCTHLLPRGIVLSWERNKMMRRTQVIHPFLLAVFPVLFLFATNIEQFRPRVLVAPLLFMLIVTALLWGLLSRVLRNPKKAGLIVSLFLMLFFLYGKAYDALPYFSFWLWRIRIDVRHVTFLAMVGLFAVGAWFAVRTRRDLSLLTRVVNVMAAVLVGMSVLNITAYGVRNWASQDKQGADELPGRTSAVTDARELPDIYYIIMDAYARQDILRDLYDYDNTEFIEFLRSKGFYVADESTCNYPYTITSFASALNMEYFSTLLPDTKPDSDDLTPMIRLLRYSEVRRVLKKHKYTVIAFAAGYMVTEMTSADVYVTIGWFGDEFPNALIEMTPVGVFSAKLARIPLLRRRILGTFEQLQCLPEFKSPKFVFAHITAPHPPFVFDRNGRPVDPKVLNRLGGPLLQSEQEVRDYRRYYTDEMTYLNGKIRTTIEAILEKSEKPPVIILQGDHGPKSLVFYRHRDSGPALRERFSILNAYYLPGKDAQGLYPKISPVNSFRVVFNNYFGTDYKRLEDRNFFCVFPRVYDLEEVTDKIRLGG